MGAAVYLGAALNCSGAVDKCLGILSHKCGCYSHCWCYSHIVGATATYMGATATYIGATATYVGATATYVGVEQE